MKHSASEASLSLKVVEKERIRKNRNRERLFFLLGTIALVLVVVLWSLSSVLTKRVMREYEEPFVITVASCLSFISYFVFLVLPDPLIYILQQKKEIDEERERELSGRVNGSASDNDGRVSDSGRVSDTTNPSNTTTPKSDDTESLAPSVKLPPLTLQQTAKISFFFFLIYFASNFLLNFSLGAGPISKISNLSSTSGFFTLLIGYYWGVEEMSTLRLGAVFLSFGAAVLTIAPSFEWSGPVTQASFFALSSAFAYGCYSIYLKVVTKDESRVSMPILFAFVGLYTLLLVVPLSVLVHCLGLVSFAVPTGSDAWGIVVNAVVGGLLPNYMWNVAFAFTTPLVVAIGLSFSTPLGLLCSWYMQEQIMILDYWASVAVVMSFAVLNVASLNKKIDSAVDARVLGFFGMKLGKDVEQEEDIDDEIKMMPCQLNNHNKPSCCNH